MSNVVVEQELVRMRAQTNFIDLARSLVADIRLDHVPREHLSLEQELMVGLARIERFVERSRSGRDVGTLCGRQVVKVLVNGLPWVDAALYAVETRHQHRSER